MQIKFLIPDIKDVVPYTFEKKKKDCAIFEPIIEKLLSGAVSSEKPEFVHMLGIPGAGKSTFYKNNKEKFADFIRIDFDAIMELLPEYQRDLKLLGSEKAFERWQMPARVAGYELLRRAVESGKNIFFDNGGSADCHRELLANVKKKGYHTAMYYINCPINIAVSRAVEREKITKRHTPKKMIEDRKLLIQKNLPLYKALVDDFYKVAWKM